MLASRKSYELRTNAFTLEGTCFRGVAASVVVSVETCNPKAKTLDNSLHSCQHKAVSNVTRIYAFQVT